MTFLLQKFNAINRSRTEVRARNGLRPTASGIAFTGRLAVVCLLLAGFLGVGSAMAQPHVLRMGDGSISVAIGDNQQVHHYLIDTDGDGDYSDETLSAAGTDPTGRGAGDGGQYVSRRGNCPGYLDLWQSQHAHDHPGFNGRIQGGHVSEGWDGSYGCR